MTLADLSAFVRSSLKWFLVSLVVLFLLWLVWAWINGASQVVFKPKGEDTAFGKFAAPFFAKTYSPVTAGRLELSASLPQGKDKANVYLFTTGKKFSDDQINNLLNFFNLSNDSKRGSGSLTTWKNTEDNTVLRVDITGGHFTYKTDLSESGSIPTSNISSNEKDILTKAGEILKKFNLLPTDIEKGAASVTFLKISTESRQTTSASSANAAEANFFRKIEDSTSAGEASIRILFGPGERVLEFDYNYSPLDPIGSPYPIISSQLAYQNFQTGKAFTKETGTFDSVTVTGVELSYWESSLPQTYFQPVWVFTAKGTVGGSEKNFTAFMPAVDPSFLQQ